MSLSRRRFLALASAAAPAVVIPRDVWAAGAAAGPRVLSLAHLHTGERLNVEYFDRGAYVPDALQAIEKVLRDFRTGDTHAIDPGLLDLLHRLSIETGTSRPFEVISGYRSPATNAMLRSHGDGVASGSLHMQGKAIDIRLGDVRLPALRNAALDLRGGGVGYYPTSNFVHVDTGRVRRW
jgi:uncharacterized protein YcbK (DUF882 family)